MQEARWILNFAMIDHVREGGDTREANRVSRPFAQRPSLLTKRTHVGRERGLATIEAGGRKCVKAGIVRFRCGARFLGSPPIIHHACGHHRRQAEFFALTREAAQRGWPSVSAHECSLQHGHSMAARAICICKQNMLACRAANLEHAINELLTIVSPHGRANGLARHDWHRCVHICAKAQLPLAAGRTALGKKLF